MSWDDLTILDTRLSDAEAQVENLRPGVHKRVHWYGNAGEKTQVSVVYIHGFSATSEELRPFPDQIASSLNANLHFTRLTGHGQDGRAMGRATLADWQADTNQALQIARAIGDKVVVVACSTAAPLVVDALARDATGIANCVFVSPNFGMTNPFLAAALRMPLVRHWGPWVMGRERHFEPISAEHSAFWTTRYDTKAVFTMHDAVMAARRVDVGRIMVPAAFIYCDDDQVVAPKQTARVASIWGGATQVLKLPKGQNDFGHLLVGDVFNPDQTQLANAFAIRFCQDNM
ncbi:MAG: alpha/beta hydrolase [Planktomarina sp.]